MNVEVISRLNGQKLNMWKSFISNAGLTPGDDADATILVWDDGVIIAAGSRKENLLKYIAVDSSRQGEGLTATVITELRKNAFENGYRHLFLYTKPKNADMFASLFFYPIAQTEDVLLMESVKDGIGLFLSSLPADTASGKVGAVVMNCNPFTLGHRYLIETAAKECHRLYVFVLSEDKSQFSAKDRFQMVKAGVADLENVTVLPTGPYLISSATFPTYFLKDRDSAGNVQCLLDIEIFTKYFVPRFSINCRYVGSEPLSPLTEQYNQALKENLPKHSVEVKELKRLENGTEPISASKVRELIKNKNTKELKAFIPDTTLEYLNQNNLI